MNGVGGCTSSPKNFSNHHPREDDESVISTADQEVVASVDQFERFASIKENLIADRYMHIILQNSDLFSAGFLVYIYQLSY